MSPLGRPAGRGYGPALQAEAIGESFAEQRVPTPTIRRATEYGLTTATPYILEVFLTYPVTAYSLRTWAVPSAGFITSIRSA